MWPLGYEVCGSHYGIIQAKLLVIFWGVREDRRSLKDENSPLVFEILCRRLYLGRGGGIQR